VEHSYRENSGQIKSRYTVRSDTSSSGFATTKATLDELELADMDWTEPSSEFLSDHPIIANFLQKQSDPSSHPDPVPTQQEQRQQQTIHELSETVRMLVMGLHLVQEDLRKERRAHSILVGIVKRRFTNTEIRLRTVEEAIDLRSNGALVPCYADLLDSQGNVLVRSFFLNFFFF